MVLFLRFDLFLQVNKIEINYAKTAKKMDMKRLKNSMWTLLTESPEKPSEVGLKILAGSFCLQSTIIVKCLNSPAVFS